MTLLDKYINTKIVIYYNDTSDSVVSLKGTLIDFDDTDIIIYEDNRNEFTVIPRHRYVRMGVSK